MLGFLSLLSKYIQSIFIFFINDVLNNVLKFMGYVRVYDINTGSDLTLLYYLLKYFRKKIPEIGLDISYPKLGVCRYVDNRYTRYICYDSKLLDIDHITTCLSAKNYYDIKSIYIIKKSKKDDIVLSQSDVTKAKKHFYDSTYFAEISAISKKKYENEEIKNILDNSDKTPLRFTKIKDIIKFYKRLNFNFFMNKNISESNILDSENEIIIRITREKFDDDLLEFVTTYEEVPYA
jgi:hypothetical protein